MRSNRRSQAGAAGLLLIAVACGKSSDMPAPGAGGSGGGAGDDNAQSGSTGTPGGAGGSGGLAAECPTEPPVYEYDCPAEQRGTRCAYPVVCQTGARTVTLTCGQHGWDIEESGAACLGGDFCPLGSSHQFQCVGNSWSVGGGGESGLCAPERVANGTPCVRSALDATPACGYYCPDGTWTVGFCGGGELGEQRYEFSPPCAGEELGNAGTGGASGDAGAGAGS
jgi:hypothetical protein